MIEGSRGDRWLTEPVAVRLYFPSKLCTVLAGACSVCGHSLAHFNRPHHSITFPFSFQFARICIAASIVWLSGVWYILSFSSRYFAVERRVVFAVEFVFDAAPLLRGC